MLVIQTLVDMDLNLLIEGLRHFMYFSHWSQVEKLYNFGYSMTDLISSIDRRCAICTENEKYAECDLIMNVVKELIRNFKKNSRSEG